MPECPSCGVITGAARCTQCGAKVTGPTAEGSRPAPDAGPTWSGGQRSPAKDAPDLLDKLTRIPSEALERDDDPEADQEAPIHDGDRHP